MIFFVANWNDGILYRKIMRMEMIYMEAKLFMKMMERFEVFASKVNTICGKNNFRGIESWLDNQDVCLRLNISLRTLQMFRDTGKLPYSQINHKMYYKTEDVESLLLYVQSSRLKKLKRNK